MTPDRLSSHWQRIRRRLAYGMVMGALLAGSACVAEARTAERAAAVANPGLHTVANQATDTTLDRLVRSLEEGDAATRRRAAAELGLRGTAARPAVPALVRALRDRDWRVRAGAAAALAVTGAPPDRIVPPLIEAFAEEASADYRDAVVEPVTDVLVAIGAPSVPHLRDALTDPRFPVRLGAARALGALGSKARDAVPDLVRALDDPNFFVATTAARAIERIEPEAGPGRTRDFKARLVRQLESESPLARLDAAAALRELGATAEAAVPALIERLRDPDERRAIHMAAMYALAAIGPAAAGAVPDLADALGSADPGIRDAARRALTSIDTPEARRALATDPRNP